MIALLSPAKTLDFESALPPMDTHIPLYRSEAKKLVNELKKLNVHEIENLMHLSNNLASLNFKRYKSFKLKHDDSNSKPAVLAFKGDVYLGLEAWLFDKNQLKIADEKLRILSGLYGILRPLDIIQPYRLEMGTTLQTERGKNLYEFWGDIVTKQLNKDIKSTSSEYIINLASNEYFKVIKPKKVKAKIINIDFREDRNGKLQFISFNAKKARGMMAKFIVDNNLQEMEHLKGFDTEGYIFDKNNSTSENFLFVK
jgi:cytoplasmic iron level regulating protein YaaA (DUF328/UPF0246 family)